MTRPAQIRNLLTESAERQRAQREAMVQTSAAIAEERAKATGDEESQKPQQP